MLTKGSDVEIEHLYLCFATRTFLIKDPSNFRYLVYSGGYNLFDLRPVLGFERFNAILLYNGWRYRFQRTISVSALGPTPTSLRWSKMVLIVHRYPYTIYPPTLL